MNQNNVSLSSQNLVIDFLRFNLQFTEKYKIEKVAKYLFQEYGCSSVFIDGKKTYSLIQTDQLSCKAKFLTSHTKYWLGTRLEFEGGQGSKFYQMIQKKPLDWVRMDLDNTTLSRIDLYYNRKLKEEDRFEDFGSFLSSSAGIIKSRFPSIKVELKSRSVAIGNRKTSPNYFRIYTRPDGKFIRFELEITLVAVKKFEFSLFASQFEKLETQLVEDYYSYINGKFDIERSRYTDWVVNNFRSIRFLQIPTNSMVSTYLTNSLKNRVKGRVENKEFVYKIFQLLSYIREVDSVSEYLVDQEYEIISFKLKDFLAFIGVNEHHYQVQKLGNFLRSLQTLPPMLSAVSTSCFTSINIFPYVKVFKQRSWYVQLAVAKEIYEYKYPFYFPKAFLNCQKKYQLQSRIAFLLAFSVVEIEKVFDVEEFLDEFTISNSNLCQVKTCLMETFVLVQEFGLIESELILVSKKKKQKNVTRLTTNLISRSKLIKFKEVTK